MSKFGNLAQYDVKADKAVRYDVEEIRMAGKTPWLMVKPATEANKPFARAQLKSSNKKLKLSSARGITVESLEATRKDDRALYPKYIITDWGNVFDDEGLEVPFNAENCKEFIDAIPDWIFDQMRQFCAVPANFAETADEQEVGN